MNRHRRPTLPLLAVILALIGVACGRDSPTAPGPTPLPPGPPLNDTPLHTLLRFEATYELGVLEEYAKLFTRDFVFSFSAASDPELVVHYGDQWGRDDERISASHLFTGFANEFGEVIPGVTSITLVLAGVVWTDDPAHSDSTVHYRVAEVDTVTMQVVVPYDEESQVYDIVGKQRFSLVRGDAAVLDSTQTASASRWYVRRWEDLSAPVFALESSALPPTRASLAHTMPARERSWGALKATYR